MLDMSSAQRRQELHQALKGGINCWEKRPLWIVSLFDSLGKEVEFDKARERDLSVR